MDDPALTPQPAPEPEALAALTARVAELERVVAGLQANAAPPANFPPRRAERPKLAWETRPVTPPPPPMPAAPILIASDLPADSAPPSFTPTPSFAAAAAKPARSLEDRLGAQVFNIVGIVAIIIATAYGLKLAIEHGYIGPVARVLIGLAAGAGVVVWSERFRRKGFAAFSYSLKAIGSGVLYLTLWAAFHLYHLLPAPVVLIAMILVTAWNAFMALTQDAELLGAYALLGGFLTPLLLSTGGNHETFLFTYLAALDLGTVALMRTKPWRRLLLPAFLGTVLFFIGWYAEFYRYDLQLHTGPFAATIAFIFLFFAIFALVSIKGWMQPEADATGKTGDVIVPVLLPLANAAFVALALYSVFQDSGLHTSLAWLMVALSALYLGLMRLQRTAVSAAMHLAVAVVLLTIAIPLKASGHTLTTAWLVEGLVLFWASTRFGPTQEKAARVLHILSAAGYALGLGSLVAHWFLFAWDAQPFLNRNLAAALVAVASLGGALWVALNDRTSGRDPVRIVWGALAAIDGVGLLLMLRQLNATFADPRGPYFNASFGTALVGLAVLDGAAWAAWKLLRDPAQRFASGAVMLAATFVAIDLTGLLFTAREWAGGYANGFSATRFATALLGLAILAAVTYTLRWMLRVEPAVRAQSGLLVGGTLAAIDIAAVLLTWREIFSARGADVDHTAFANADFGTALLGLATLAVVIWSVRRTSHTAGDHDLSQHNAGFLAAASLLAFNLLAILSVEREIGALWHRTDANLQRSLAISGFLMAYGAGLLAIGFWRRIAFIRWQALALLLFTICKVFLYDIGSLSAGYRVASFFGLGAVLMAVSFAYQKDWLGLKTPAAPAPLEPDLSDEAPR